MSSPGLFGVFVISLPGSCAFRRPIRRSGRVINCGLGCVRWGGRRGLHTFMLADRDCSWRVIDGED